ncbi:MAG: FAD-binding protein, partial [Alphaproteobacteria bacterium]
MEALTEQERAAAGAPGRLKGRAVTVVGAGIGGLAVAVAMARRGARVTVIEQAPEITEIGAGLQITPNGAAVLAALGLGRALGRIGVRAGEVRLHDGLRDEDAPLARVDLRGTLAGNPHGYWLVHRADLVAMLLAAARRLGVQIVTGARVVGVALGFDEAVLAMESGSKRRTRLLIGADGLNSVVRVALGNAEEPRFTGQLAWRALVEPLHVPLWEVGDAVRLALGPGRHIVCYPLRGGRLLNLVAVEERARWSEADAEATRDPGAMRAAFADFAPRWRRLLACAREPRP